ncbi:MAG: hypothetical protein LWW91_07745, partial [Bacteroidales bacterium]|nr:hypothetical protein [Bacteroidales bacterium]
LNSLLSSLPFDFVCRQKLAGMNMNFFYVNQFPVLSPDSISNDYQKIITQKQFELTYTSWDIKSFADDIWKEADENLKAAIKKHIWTKNKRNSISDTCEWPVSGPKTRIASAGK